jgi:hypothetical protein
MGPLLTISNIYIPEFMQKRKLAMLFQATAGAFQVIAPPSQGLSYKDGLELYARFTMKQADIAIRQGKEAEIQTRLFQNAYLIGQQLRAGFKIHTPEDVMRMGTLIYRILKIDFQGEPGGNIVIRRCFFSAYYSSQVCRLISSLDAGLLVGLAGGGKLIFAQRITEGNTCCQAYLESPERLK